MIFGSPNIDLGIAVFLLVVALLISLVVLALAKRKILALIVFSILGNAVILMGVFTRSEMFDYYSIAWLKTFSVFIWPLLNIFFIIRYVRTKKSVK